MAHTRRIATQSIKYFGETIFAQRTRDGEQQIDFRYSSQNQPNSIDLSMRIYQKW